jgi:hypothetical protein
MPAGTRESRERIVVAKHRGSGLRQWAVLLAPLVAVYLQQQLAFAFVSWACSRRAHVLLQLPTLLAAIILGASALSAWRSLSRAGSHEPGDERSSDARARFMSTCALILAAFCTLLLIGFWLPIVFIDPCQR